MKSKETQEFGKFRRAKTRLKDFVLLRKIILNESCTLVLTAYNL